MSFCSAIKIICLLSPMAVAAPVKPLNKVSKTLTLEEVLDSVDRYYPEIIKAHAEVEAQRGKAKASLGAFDPKLSVDWGRHSDGYPENELLGAKLGAQIAGTGILVDMGWDRSIGAFPSYEGALQTGSEGRWKAGLTIPLIRDLVIDQVRAKRQIEGLKSNEKEEAARIVKIETYVLAASTYWQWLARIEVQKIVRDLLSLAEQRDNILSKRVKHGDAPIIDHVDNQRVLLQRKAQLLKAQQDSLNASLDMSLFLRNEKEEMISPVEDQAPSWLNQKSVKPAPEMENVDSIVSAYPGLQKLKYELQQAEVNQSLNYQSLFPRLDLRLESARYEGELPVFRKDPNEFFVGLQFSIPLANVSARGNRYAAQMELKAKKMELAFKEQKLRVELNQVATEVRTARDIFLANLSEFNASDKVAKAERKKFERGDSNMFMVNAREVDAALSRMKAAGALVDYHQKDLKLRLIRNDWIRKY